MGARQRVKERNSCIKVQVQFFDGVFLVVENESCVGFGEDSGRCDHRKRNNQNIEFVGHYGAPYLRDGAAKA